MRDEYLKLLRIETYAEEEPVEFYRQLNGVNVGEPVTIPESIFLRLTLIGRAYSLHYVPMIDLYSDNQTYNRRQLCTLMDELLFILRIVDDTVIEHFACPILKLLQEIIRSSTDDSLCIVGL